MSVRVNQYFINTYLFSYLRFDTRSNHLLPLFLFEITYY